MSDLPIPPSDPFSNDDWRTVRLVVEYRFRAPADWHLPRLGLDRDLPLPPMHYCTGMPDLETGGPGTWKSHKVPPLEFMTYRHVFETEREPWPDLEVPADVARQEPGATVADRSGQPCPCGQGTTVGAVLDRGPGDLCTVAWRCARCIAEAAATGDRA